MMQEVVLLADPEAENAGVPVDPGLQPDNIELNDIDTEHWAHPHGRQTSDQGTLQKEMPNARFQRSPKKQTRPGGVGRSYRV
jgi:hypothetical protein